MAVEEEKIKGKEDAFTPAKSKSLKTDRPVLIDASDLAIEHGVLDVQILGD